MNALMSCDTRAGSVPKARVAIIGFRGSELTSATGAKLMCTPAAREACPVSSANSRTAASAPAPSASNAIACGNNG